LSAREGLSISDFLQKESVAERPTPQELAKRIAKLTPVKYKRSPADILREERSGRDRALARLASIPR